MNDLSNPKQQRIKRRHTRSDHFVLLNMRCQRVQKKASETWMRRTHTLRIIHQVSPLSAMARFCLFFSVTPLFSHLEQQNTFIKGAVCKNWLPAKSMLGNNEHKLAAPERWCCLIPDFQANWEK